jgi:hypothetical protein
VKRSISLVAITVAACVLVFSAGGAAARSKGGAKAKPVTVKCRISLTQQPEYGQDFVLPRDAGEHYGRVDCPKRGFGTGAIHDTYTVPDSGDTVAKYVVYLPHGTFSGTFDLTPGEGSEPTGTSFQNESWTGTTTVDAGSGIFKGVTLAKNTKSKMDCTSNDTVHLVCHATISLVLPSA